MKMWFILKANNEKGARMLKFFKRKTMQEIIISLKIEKDKPLQLKGLSRAIGI